MTRIRTVLYSFPLNAGDINGQSEAPVGGEEAPLYRLRGCSDKCP